MRVIVRQPFFQALKQAACADIAPKITTILYWKKVNQENRTFMRFARMIFAGSLAALLGVIAPASAKKADAQKSTEEKSTGSSCHSYQQAPNGSWTEHPCEEVGGWTEHKPPKSPEERPR
jgi:hypothetical protein